MTKEEAKHLSEVLKAYSEGKEIEIQTEWGCWLPISTCSYPRFNGNPMDYRIKPEQKLRPYANAEEFLKAQKEHGPYLIRSTTKIPEYSSCFVLSDNESVGVAFSNEKGNIGFTRYTFESLYNMSITYKHMTWQDGTPCGVVE